MTRDNLLGIEDMITELNLGRATLKFILTRFAGFLPSERVKGSVYYSPALLAMVIKIKDLMDQGHLPSQIEALLKEDGDEPDLIGPEIPVPDKNANSDVRMSKDALGFIQDLFQDIKGHQSRIALAHEKRAMAEERKAVAIEKRALAEEKKAQAMNNIASALQEMSRHRPADPQTVEIAGQAAMALSMNEVDPELDIDTNTLDPEMDSLFDMDIPASQDISDPDLDPMDIRDGLEPELHSEYGQADAVELDDLSLLIDEPVNAGDASQAQEGENIDDLWALVDGAPQAQAQAPDLGRLMEDPQTVPEMDDLSLLVDSAAAQQASQAAPMELDDLSLLIDPPETAPEPHPELDDLSLLIDQPMEPAPVPLPLDDLSLLIDSPADAPSVSETHATGTDDLWALVDQPAKPPETPEQPDMDDLSLLVESANMPPTPSVEQENAAPSLKPDITPEQDMAKYKAAVMKVIIGLKKEGQTPAQTTERLNQDGVPTISGKPQWGEKAIANIYRLIESAQ